MELGMIGKLLLRKREKWGLRRRIFLWLLDHDLIKVRVSFNWDKFKR